MPKFPGKIIYLRCTYYLRGGKLFSSHAQHSQPRIVYVCALFVERITTMIGMNKQMLFMSSTVKSIAMAPYLSSEAVIAVHIQMCVA